MLPVFGTLRYRRTLTTVWKIFRSGPEKIEIRLPLRGAMVVRGEFCSFAEIPPLVARNQCVHFCVSMHRISTLLFTAIQIMLW